VESEDLEGLKFRVGNRGLVLGVEGNTSQHLSPNRLHDFDSESIEPVSYFSPPIRRDSSWIIFDKLKVQEYDNGEIPEEKYTNSCSTVRIMSGMNPSRNLLKVTGKSERNHGGLSQRVLSTAMPRANYVKFISEINQSLRNSQSVAASDVFRS
jgi:hypothetical protein